MNTETTQDSIVTANVLRFIQAVARQHRSFVIRELFHGCEAKFLKENGLQPHVVRYARNQSRSDEDHPFFTGVWKRNERESIPAAEANAMVTFARGKLVL